VREREENRRRKKEKIPAYCPLVLGLFYAFIVSVFSCASFTKPPDALVLA